jgi:hypothetical protein
MDLETVEGRRKLSSKEEKMMKNCHILSSDAYPGCLSRDFYVPIPDPGSKNGNKREG